MLKTFTIFIIKTQLCAFNKIPMILKIYFFCKTPDKNCSEQFNYNTTAAIGIGVY